MIKTNKIWNKIMKINKNKTLIFNKIWIKTKNQIKFNKIQIKTKDQIKFNKIWIKTKNQIKFNKIQIKSKDQINKMFNLNKVIKPNIKMKLQIVNFFYIQQWMK